jgi:hypothetical protein
MSLMTVRAGPQLAHSCPVEGGTASTSKMGGIRHDRQHLAVDSTDRTGIRSHACGLWKYDNPDDICRRDADADRGSTDLGSGNAHRVGGISDVPVRRNSWVRARDDASGCGRWWRVDPRRRVEPGVQLPHSK